MIYRFSYSILSCWDKGDYERAIDMWVGRPTDETEAMRQGKLYHEQWEQEAIKTGCLPAVFGGRKLNSPLFEATTKKEVMLNEWLQFVGVLDVLDGDLGIDYKTGVSEAAVWANTMQGKAYQVLYPQLKRFEYHCYNQHIGEASMAIIHLSDTTLRDGVEFIYTNAVAMKHYIDVNGIKKLTKEEYEAQKQPI